MATGARAPPLGNGTSGHKITGWRPGPVSNPNSTQAGGHILWHQWGIRPQATLRLPRYRHYVDHTVHTIYSAMSKLSTDHTMHRPHYARPKLRHNHTAHNLPHRPQHSRRTTADLAVQTTTHRSHYATGTPPKKHTTQRPPYGEQTT